MFGRFYVTGERILPMLATFGIVILMPSFWKYAGDVTKKSDTFSCLRQKALPVELKLFNMDYLKDVSAIFLSNFYFSPNDSSSKTMKNVFYFI